MAKKNKLARNKINVSTQQFLDIAEVRDNTVIMRDGTMRSVIIVSSINFALKSEEEQNAIISSYVTFLNSIYFPIQIVIQSRELNIDDYLADLKQKEKEQTNELLKIQTSEYIQYIQELISLGKIMNKYFYVVVPYDPMSDKQKKFLKRLFEAFKPVSIIKLKREIFLRRRTELTRRVGSVITSLASIGVNSIELDTQGLIELYYNSYNLRTSTNQKLVDVRQLRVAE